MSSQNSEFERLAKDHYRSAYGFAFRITGNAADAEDLVQETFLRAYRFFHRYKTESPFSSWLYRIMLNANVDLIRRKGKLRTTSLDCELDRFASAWLCTLNNATGPDSKMLSDAMGEPVQQALLSISTQFRTAVLLADVEGLSYDEIAQIMSSSVGTVRSRVHRGRKMLRKQLLQNRTGTCGELSFEL